MACGPARPRRAPPGHELRVCLRSQVGGRQRPLKHRPYSANVWTLAAFGVTVYFLLQNDALWMELEPYSPLHGEISLIGSH